MSGEAPEELLNTDADIARLESKCALMAKRMAAHLVHAGGFVVKQIHDAHEVSMSNPDQQFTARDNMKDLLDCFEKLMSAAEKADLLGEKFYMRRPVKSIETATTDSTLGVE